MNPRDVIFVKNISMLAIVGRDCWHREKAQRVLVSVRAFFPIEVAGSTDSVEDTLDYRKIYNDSIMPLSLVEHSSLFEFLSNAREQVSLNTMREAEISVTLPNALLSPADGVSLVHNGRGLLDSHTISLKVHDLRLFCIIGVNPAERIEKQPVVINIEARDLGSARICKDYQELLALYIKVIEDSQFLTLEAFVVMVAMRSLICFTAAEVTVSAYKPSVFGAADGPGVEITRDRNFLEPSLRCLAI